MKLVFRMLTYSVLLNELICFPTETHIQNCLSRRDSAGLKAVAYKEGICKL